MKIRHFASCAVVAGVVATALGFVAQRDPAPTAPPANPPAAAQAGADQSFTIDGVHSSVMFRIEHMGVCNFYGAFKNVSGTYTLGQTPAFNIAVKTDSVDTRNADRDTHLKSPDFFNAIEFPEITFKSTGAEKSGETWKVNGDLTLHGVTKPITVDMKVWPAKTTPRGTVSGFETMFTIKRSDYGMDYGVAQGALGDEVSIVIGGEGGAK